MKSNPLIKIEFLKNYKKYFAAFSLFNAEVINTCEFHRNILSKNEAMAVSFQKCTSSS